MVPYGYWVLGDVTTYSPSANAYQKITLVLTVLKGTVFVPRGKRNWVPEDFRGHPRVVEVEEGNEVLSRVGLGFFGLMMRHRKLARVWLLAPSNEKSFVNCLLCAIVLRVRFVFCCWDPPGITVRNRKDWMGRLRCWVMNTLFVACVRKATVLILNLHPGFLGTWFPEALRRKVRVFPNGTRVDEIGKVEHRDKVVGRIGVNGAFQESKGCWDIAKLFVRLWREGVVRSLVWIGGGRSRQAVQDWLVAEGVPRERLIAPGNVPNAEAINLLATCEIALNAYRDVPSWRWNYVLKIPEFFALGLPVVSVATPGAEAYVCEGETGCLFAPGDMDGAFAKLKALLQNPEKVAAMRQRCETVVREYDWARINQHIGAVIREFCEEKPLEMKWEDRGWIDKVSQRGRDA